MRVHIRAMVTCHLHVIPRQCPKLHELTENTCVHLKWIIIFILFHNCQNCHQSKISSLFKGVETLSTCKYNWTHIQGVTNTITRPAICRPLLSYYCKYQLHNWSYIYNMLYMRTGLISFSTGSGFPFLRLTTLLYPVIFLSNVALVPQLSASKKSDR